MDYESMSDFDVNKAVAEALGYKTFPRFSYYGEFMENHPNSVWFQRPHQQHREHKDYCNNPSDAWPVIVENKISMSWSGSYWCVLPPFSFNHVCGMQTLDGEDGPLRCAMIVYLKMMEQKDGKS